MERPVPHHELELDEDTLRRLLDEACSRIVEHVRTLGDQPAQNTAGGLDLARRLAENAPETGTGFEGLLDDLFERIVPVSLNTAGPGYLGYIPGGGLLQSAVADLIAGAINRYVGVWLPAPGLAQLELNVVRWLAEMTGLPEGTTGFLTTGGSIANLCAIVTARIDRLGESFGNGTLYASDQVHHSVTKAARIAGIARDRVRAIPTDERFRMRPAELERAIREDVDRGLTPFLVVASAGTTNTGSVDDLPEIGRIARDAGAWFHVDAAYGGFFHLTERGRTALAGMGDADSLVVDPHKGLFLPYGTGALLVRDGSTLEAAFEETADYMPPASDTSGLVSFSSISPELSRDFRGLRLWLPIKMHGVDAFRRALDEKLDLARYAAERLRKIPGIEIVAEPELSIVAFRAAGPDDGPTRSLQKRINASKRVFVSSTKLRGHQAIRICVLSFRTHRDRIDEILDLIESAMGELGSS